MAAILEVDENGDHEFLQYDAAPRSAGWKAKARDIGGSPDYFL
jgi:hypothetical protein